MARIDYTYFQSGLRAIPNLDKPQVLAALNSCIIEYEAFFFTYQFGYEFKKDMLENPSETKYAAILEGTEYTDADGYLQKWNGINEPIADYVYFQFIKEQTVKLMGAGYMSAQVENSTTVAPVIIPTKVYNRMVSEMEKLYKYLVESTEDYTRVQWKFRRAINEYCI